MVTSVKVIPVISDYHKLQLHKCRPTRSSAVTAHFRSRTAHFV